MVSTLAILCAVGSLAGTLAGLLGVGGGIVMVPALILVLPGLGVGAAVVSQVAVATSLACICVISVASARAHHRRGGVLWPVVLGMAPGLILGALLGACIADYLSSAVLQRVVGAAAVLIAVKMFAGGQPSAQRALPGLPALGGAGLFIGTLSSLIGIGGGSLTVPFLNWCNTGMTRAVGTSAACGMAIAWSGVFGFVIAGWGAQHTGVWSLGYVSLPAVAALAVASVACVPLGAALAYRLPTRALKRIFAALLLVVGVQMLLG